MYAGMRGGEDEFTNETKTSVLHEVLADMNKSAPSAVNEHDREQHDR